MTREEAIAILKTPIHCADKGDEKDMREALSMAIKALENHDTFMKYSYEQGKKDALSQEPIPDNATNGKEVLIKYCLEHSGEEIYDLLKRVHDESMSWTDSRCFIIEWLEKGE